MPRKFKIHGTGGKDVPITQEGIKKRQQPFSVLGPQFIKALQQEINALKSKKGTDITSLKPHQIAARGIAYVPEERHIIPNLSVRENLKLAMLVRGKLTQQEVDETLEQIFNTFIYLKRRLDNRGDALSGGEQ